MIIVIIRSRFGERNRKFNYVKNSAVTKTEIQKKVSPSVYVTVTLPELRSKVNRSSDCKTGAQSVVLCSSDTVSSYILWSNVPQTVLTLCDNVYSRRPEYFVPALLNSTDQFSRSVIPVQFLPPSSVYCPVHSRKKSPTHPMYTLSSPQCQRESKFCNTCC